MSYYFPPRVIEPGMRCSAYYYVTRRGLPATMCYLQELGLRSARAARLAGQAAVRVPEGPFLVHTWVQETWDAAAASMAPVVTAWEFAAHGGMLTGDDAEFVSVLHRGTRALAARLGVELRLAREGPPELSDAWPDWVWSVIAGVMAGNCAESGDWHLQDSDLDAAISGCRADGRDLDDPVHPHGYWEAGDYDDVTAYPGPQGEQAGYAIGY